MCCASLTHDAVSIHWESAVCKWSKRPAQMKPTLLMVDMEICEKWEFEILK